MRRMGNELTRTSRHVILSPPRGRSHTTSVVGLDSIQRVLIVLESIVSVCGLGGGTYMASHPVSVMPLRYLEGTWFHTWRWPGVALFVFVGLGPALAVMATVQGRRIEVAAHLAVGVGLVAWIVIEAAWMVVSPVLQITFALIGLSIIVLATNEARRRRSRPGSHPPASERV